jgi:hypothetical protein
MKWIPLLMIGLGPQAVLAADDWQFRTTLYGWFPGVTTEVETPLGTVESEVEFDEILESLDMALFGAIEARKGRLSLVGDIQYLDVGAEAEVPFGTLNRAAVGSEMFIVSAYATYAIVDDPEVRFDVGAGLRHLDATIDAEISGDGASQSQSFTAEGGWTDALVVARSSWKFDERWSGIAYIDAGGFGFGDSSELTWGGAVGAGYQINPKWSTVFGYRHLTLERAFGGLDVDVDVSGPFLGFQGVL